MKNLLACLLLCFLYCASQSQTLTPPFLENFNNTTLTTNGWYVPTPGGAHDFKWYATVGDTLPNGVGTGGLRMKLNSPTNYAASPGINLIGGKTYTALFKQKVASAAYGRNMKIAFNTTRSLVGATVFYDFECPNNIYVNYGFIQQSPTFTPPTTGVYYLIYYYYNANGTTGYLYSYLDDCGVEETNYPAITLNNPVNNFARNEDYFTDSTKVSIDVTASDVDGSIKFVEYYVDSTLLFRDSFPPYNFVWKDAIPGVYKIWAKATDNRNNIKISDTSTITINFRAGMGALKPYVQWDFNGDNPNGAGLNYWQFPLLTTGQTQSYVTNTLFRGTQCIYINGVANGNNFAASPALYLVAGNTYNIEFLGRANGGAKTFNFYYSQAATLTGAGFIGSAVIPAVSTNASDPSFIEPASLIQKIFTVPVSGVYNILINYPTTGTNVGNIKIKIDQIRVIGNGLNVGPTAKILYPIAGLNYAENSKIIFAVDAKDKDGTVVKVEYYANGIKVAETTTTPFNATWNTPPAGSVEVYAKVFDNSGGYGFSPTIIINGVPNQFKATSFLGTSINDEIRGAAIKENNDIVYAANIGNITIAGATKYYVNGATDASLGAIIIMNSDGKTVKSITRVCAKISDLSKDRNDNLYIAAVGEGTIKLNATATIMMYIKAPTVGKNVFRVDAGPKGKTAILEVNESDIDDVTTTGGNILLLENDGTTLATYGGISQYTADVCIDENTQTVIGVGFKNFNTIGEIGGLNLPVYVPVIRGYDYAGTQKWLDYDWGKDETVTTNNGSIRQWLNLAANNMADARLNRCTIGKDGKLYVAGQVYGGNHLFRYDAKDVTLPGKMATGGDNWFNMNNTGTEIHSYFGRYEPSTGVVIKTQTFTARLPNGKGNTLRCDLGNVDADELGNVYLTGISAFGFPMTVEYQPGDYTGGGFIMKCNNSMNTRIYSMRFNTGGFGKALAVKNNSQMAYGGGTNDTYMYLTNPTLQTTNAGGYDAFYGVINDNNCSLPDSATSIAPTSFERKGLAAYNMLVDNNCKPIAKIIPIGTTATTAIADSVRVKVFVDATANADFVKRHFQITPYDDAGNILSNANTKTATITLYFTQADFDAYNLLNTAKLPTGAADVDGISRIIIDKYAGISSDDTGIPSTYTGAKQTINPADVNIIWNATQGRWEITFDVTGFSGFFVKGFNTYIFTGNGNWSDASNWKDGNVPPLQLLDKSAIIIDNIITGECFLDLPAAQIQQIKTGASLNIMPGKKLRLPSRLVIE